MIHCLGTEEDDVEMHMNGEGYSKCPLIKREWYRFSSNYTLFKDVKQVVNIHKKDQPQDEESWLVVTLHRSSVRFLS